MRDCPTKRVHGTGLVKCMIDFSSILALHVTVLSMLSYLGSRVRYCAGGSKWCRTNSEGLPSLALF